MIQKFKYKISYFIILCMLCTYLTIPSDVVKAITTSTITDKYMDGSGMVDGSYASLYSGIINTPPACMTMPMMPTYSYSLNSYTGVPLFNGTIINDAELSDNIKTITFRVDGLQDGPNEVIQIDGMDIPLINGIAGTTVINNYSYIISFSGYTTTLTITKSGCSSIQAQNLINGLKYKNTRPTPTRGNRIVTLYSIQDDGGTANGGADTASLNLPCMVNVISKPSAPIMGTATAGDGQATVSFTAPVNDGGSPITGYTVTSNPGGFTGTGTGSPIVVNGLTNGTAYTFTVKAINSEGIGDASSASNNVTPTSVTPLTINTAPNCMTIPTMPIYSYSLDSYTGVPLFNGTTINNAQSSDNIKTITFRVDGLQDGLNEVIQIDGMDVPLINGIAGTTVINNYSYIIFVNGYTATLTITKSGWSSIQAQNLINGLKYKNTRPTPTSGNRIVMLNSIQDDGGTANGGVDTASLNLPCMVNVISKPSAPIIGTATAEDGQATVSFAAPVNDGGSPITGYTVTSNPGGFTGTGTGSPIVVNGLTNGTTYTFTVKAINSEGIGEASSESNNVTPTSVNPISVPGVPTEVIATSGNGQATVSFTAPINDGGSPITGYTVTSSPGGFTGTGTGSPIIVNGLTNGTTYTFTVKAINSEGIGEASNTSNSVTPFALNTAPNCMTMPTMPTYSYLLDSYTGVALFNGTVINDAQSSDNIKTITFRVDGLQDDSNEVIQIDGMDVPLINGITGTTVINNYSYIISVSGNTATLTITKSGCPSIQAQDLINGLKYKNTKPTPTRGSRIVTLYSIQDDGGTANGGVDTASLNLTCMVNVVSKPSAPIMGTATAENGQATVSFTAPVNDGGSPITGYTVTSNPGGFTGTGTGSPIVVNGLANGTAYTFTVKAINSEGIGDASSASNSIVPTSVPGVPTEVTATSGNGQATVSFTVPVNDGGSAITGYTVTSSPGGFTGTGTGSPIVVNGLANGTAYTFTVKAINSEGIGDASSASNSVTPTSVPGVPTEVTATSGNGQATVSFTAPVNDGGSAITGYTVTSNPGGFTGTGTGSPIVVNGLTNGTAYTFTVTATNGIGTGSASVSSDSIIPSSGVPQVTPTFTPSAGAVAFGTQLQIISAGADHIYYTTDGTDPATTVGGTTLEYNDLIRPIISGPIIVKAIATKAGTANSAIGIADYIQAETSNLTDISLSGTLNNYSFEAGTYNYNGVIAASGVDSITVTPTGVGTITVNGVVVASGAASAPIVLTAGVENTITVTAVENGKSAKTYVIKVTGSPASTEITSFDPIASVPAGNAGSAIYANAAAVIAALQASVTANGNVVSVPVSTWVDTDGYNPNAAGSYTFTANLGTIPSGYANSENHTATVEVVVGNPITYTLTYIAGSNGTISGQSVQNVISGTIGSAVTAVPNSGYHFVNWSDNVTTATRTDRNIENNINVTAFFAADTPLPPTPTPTPTPQPTTEVVTVPVTDGSEDNTISKTEVQRTTNTDGTKKDDVQYTAGKAQETVDALKNAGKDTARIVIPDVKDEVSEAKVAVPKTTIDVLANGGVNLEIDTENARITVPKESVKDVASDVVDDLYFRLVPIKEAAQQASVEQRAKKEEIVQKAAGNSNVSVVGRPMTIETNMKQTTTDITLPLKNVTLPTDPAERQAFLDRLAVFIEHSDETKELLKGKIVEYKSGVYGIRFTIHKYSTFTIIKMDTQNSAINLSAAEFDKNTSKQADVSTTMTLNGNTLVSISNGSKTLVNGTDYEVKDNVVTINKSYLAQQSTGTTTLTFNFSAGNTQNLIVTIKDTTSSTSGGSSGGSGGSSSSGGSAPSPEKSELQRIYGQDRVSTAIAIAKATYKDKVSKVILASSDNYPDALSGSVLAYKEKAPILLVGKDVEDQEKVIAYMKENMNSTGKVYILGGLGSVSKDVENKVNGAGFSNVTRIGGADRYETAAKIADEVGVKEGTPVIIVSGENYPDAISVSSSAAVNQYPIFMVSKDEISSVVRNKISTIKPGKIYIIGLQGAVSTGVEDQLKASVDKENVVRIGGQDRYETSLNVAKYFNTSVEKVSVASGENFPDALAGSSYAANNNSPIILVGSSLTEAQKEYLKNAKLKNITIFGGTGAVNTEVENAINELIKK